MEQAVAELAAVKARIAAAERAAGRAAGLGRRWSPCPRRSTPPRSGPLIEAGHRVFGENRVQEAEGQMARAEGASSPTSNCT